MPSGGRPRRVATGLTAPTALTWVGNRLYVADTETPGSGRITVLEGFTGNGFTSRRVLLDGLPLGSHFIGSIVPGPGGRLFVGLGALEDHSGPPAQVLSFSPSGGAPVAEATGLRTAFGLAFWGQRLLVTDNGPDQVRPVSRPAVRLRAPGDGGQLRLPQVLRPRRLRVRGLPSAARHVPRALLARRDCRQGRRRLRRRQRLVGRAEPGPERDRAGRPAHRPSTRLLARTAPGTTWSGSRSGRTETCTPRSS